MSTSPSSALSQGAFDKANSANILAQAAFNSSNTVGTITTSAYAFANTVNVKVDASYAWANTVNVTADAAFSKANASNVLAQAAFDSSNTVNTFAYLVDTKANLVFSISAHSNSAYDTANTALATAAIAINYDNLANGAFDKANSANILAQFAFDTANTKVNKSGDTMTGDLKFGSGGGILNLPTDEIAITANVLNDASGFIAAAFGVSTVYANTEVIIQANTGGATFSQWNFNKDGTLIFPDSTVQSTAFTGSAIDQFARNTANAANVLAQNAYNYANTLGINVANSLIIVATAPANNKGAGGDTKGMVYLANNYFYYCTANYNGSTNIWSRIASTDAW